MEINDRLKLIRKSLEMNQTDFGAKIGLSQTSIGLYEKGSRDLTERIIAQLCQTYSVNEDWLRTGEGEMFVDDTPALIERMKDELNLSEREIEMLTIFLDFPPEERQQVLDFVDDFAAKLAAHRAQERIADALPSATAQKTAPVAEDSPSISVHELTETDMADVEEELAAIRQELIAEKKAAARSSASTSTHAAKKA